MALGNFRHTNTTQSKHMELSQTISDAASGHVSLNVSFVIPALNEESFIAELLRSIRRYCPEILSYETIVVDNGSQDRTVELAREEGAKILRHPGASLGALRNRGVEKARGEVIVFLDADIRLTPSWEKQAPKVLEYLTRNPKLITGSRCRPSAHAGWVARAWMDASPTGIRSARAPVSHLGTGHMLVSRGAFLEIGGFDESILTGEDFEFCQRAKRRGNVVEAWNGLDVVHTRLPRNTREFFRRELWHGSGDGATLAELVRSWVATVAILFAALHMVVLIAGVLVSSHLRSVLLVGGVGAIAAIPVLGALRRGGWGDPLRFIQRTVLVYVYLWARFWSLCRGTAPTPRSSST